MTAGGAPAPLGSGLRRKDGGATAERIRQEEGAASYFQRNRHDRALQGDQRIRAFAQKPGF